jgi:hypothetical protein
MYTVVYSKENEAGARQAAAALSKKFNAKNPKTIVQLASAEHIRVWNTAASSLHVSLAQV